MATAQEFLEQARREIGYTESPPGSNRTKFAAEARHANGTYWCSTFVVALMRRVGLDHEPAYSAGTAVMLSAYRNAGRLFKNPQPGDLVIYDFPGGRIANDPSDHIGIVESVNGNKTITTIEGNTSAGSSGSQSNGGGVFRRVRELTYVVGFARPYFDEEDDVTEADLDKIKAMIHEATAPLYKALYTKRDGTDKEHMNELEKKLDIIIGQLAKQATDG